MRRWVVGGIIATVIGFNLLIAGCGVLIGIANPEKSFSLPRVDVVAELAPDASMHVVEHITYDFTGPFSYGTRPIPVGAYQLTDMRVTENGQELVSVGAPYNLQWFFSAEDESRTFDIEYTVRPGATVGPDIAEVYWKWVGDLHPKIDKVTATLTVPPGAGEVKAWGHGDLTGQVTIDGDTVRWSAPDVPQGSFVEGRVAIPSSRFTVPPIGTPRLDTILAQERALGTSRERSPSGRSTRRGRGGRASRPCQHRRALRDPVRHRGVRVPVLPVRARTEGRSRDRRVLPRPSRRPTRGRRHAPALGQRATARVRRHGHRPRAARLAEHHRGERREGRSGPIRRTTGSRRRRRRPTTNSATSRNG